MRKNIQNNHNSWHKSIDAINSMPDGSSLVREGAWDRLSIKLGAAEQYKRSRRFYLIAASLSGLIIVLCAGLYVWTHYNNSSKEMPFGNAASSVAKQTNKDSIKPGFTLTSEDPGKPVKQAPAVRKPQRFVANAFSLPDSSSQNPLVVITKDSILSDQPFEKPDLVIQATEKKSYRIKHINDFADTLESTPGMTIRVKPLLRYLWPDENSSKASLGQPVKEHHLTIPPLNQN